MLARVGVKVDLNAEPKSKFFAAISAAGGFDCSFYLLGWTPTTLESFNVFQYIMGCRDPEDQLGRQQCRRLLQSEGRRAGALGPAGAGRREARRDFRPGLADLAVRRRRLHPAASAGAGLGRFKVHSRDPAAGQLLRLRLGQEGLIAFILRRLLASIGVLIAVGLIAFAMFRYVGDPVNQMVGIETSAAEREAAAPSARPRSAGDRPGGALSHQRGAVRFRRELPVQAAGRRSHRRAHAGDPRARARRVDPGAGGGRADGRLRGPAPRQRARRDCFRRCRSSAYRCRRS